MEKKEETETDPDFSYKDVSQLSEVTDDVYAESAADVDADLGDYNRLMQQTKKRMHVLGKLRRLPNYRSFVRYSI